MHFKNSHNFSLKALLFLVASFTFCDQTIALDKNDCEVWLERIGIWKNTDTQFKHSLSSLVDTYNKISKDRADKAIGEVFSENPDITSALQTVLSFARINKVTTDSQLNLNAFPIRLQKLKKAFIAAEPELIEASKGALSISATLLSSPPADLTVEIPVAPPVTESKELSSDGKNNETTILPDQKIDVEVDLAKQEAERLKNERRAQDEERKKWSDLFERFSNLNKTLESYSHLDGTPVQKPTEKDKAALENIFKFRESLFQAFHSREFLNSWLPIYLIKGGPVLIVGEGSGGKTTLADAIASSFRVNGESNWGSVQLKQEMSTAEIIGIPPKANLEAGSTKIDANQTVFSKKMVVLDEFLRPKLSSLEDLLEVFEKLQLQGQPIAARWFFLPTNVYLPQLTARDVNQERNPFLQGIHHAYGPLFSRIGDVVLISKGITDKMATSLLNGRRDQNNFSTYSEDDIKALQSIADQVTLPASVEKTVKNILFNMEMEISQKASASVEKYIKDKERDGVISAYPLSPTKLFDSRTYIQVGRYLRAFVAIDWVKKNGARPLQITSSDLIHLEDALTTIAAGDSELAEDLKLAKAGHNLKLEAQINTIFVERAAARQAIETFVKAPEAAATQKVEELKKKIDQLATGKLTYEATTNLLRDLQQWIKDKGDSHSEILVLTDVLNSLRALHEKIKP
ncbi:MAG: hypothetical protein JWQ35_932 [Bacteriovoracaceae bacterium]|nr:hypothetical protein [Bacteriovoracaceae bacterium]